MNRDKWKVSGRDGHFDQLCIHARQYGTTMRNRGGSYDNANINTLQAALNLACEELGVSEDQKKCEAVAVLILGYARTGQSDVNKLKAFAIERFECSL